MKGLGYFLVLCQAYLYSCHSKYKHIKALHCNLRRKGDKCLGKFVKPDAVEPNRCGLEGEIIEKQVTSIYQEKLIGKRIPNNSYGLRRLYIQQCTQHGNKQSEFKI
jgi:hypothetical protein